MIKDTRSNREYASRTTETARWAREQVKRQVGMFEHDHMFGNGPVDRSKRR